MSTDTAVCAYDTHHGPETRFFFSRDTRTVVVLLRLFCRFFLSQALPRVVCLSYIVAVLPMRQFFTPRHMLGLDRQGCFLHSASKGACLEFKSEKASAATIPLFSRTVVAFLYLHVSMLRTPRHRFRDSFEPEFFRLLQVRVSGLTAAVGQ